jgi:hypothetical protein
MKSPARILFLAGMVFTSAAFAGTDINNCMTASGQVTLTDEVCPSGAQTVKVISVPSTEAAPVAEAPAAEATVRTASVEHYTVGRMPSRWMMPARFTPPSRGLARDVATLKAARANMHMVDSAAQMAKSQRLAGLQ